MSLILTIIQIFAVSILILSFIRFKLAILLYISFLILVPSSGSMLIANMYLTPTLINLILLLAFTAFKIKNNISLNFRIIRPFLFLFFSLILISIFSEMPNSSLQLRLFFSDLFQTCTLSFIIWNISIKDEKFITHIKWTLIVSFLLAAIYSISIISMGGFNPYTSYISAFYGREYDFAERFANSERARNQGTMQHPMTWVFYLSGISISFLSLFYKERKKTYLLFVCLFVFCIVIADVRTGLVSTVISALYISYRYNKISFKTVSYGIAIVLLLVGVVVANNELSERFISLIDFGGTKTDLTGSSFQMRINQIHGALREINNSQIFGKGYGWTTYYLRYVNLTHPTMYSFESLILVILCNHGVAGFIIWVIFAAMIFRTTTKILKQKRNTYFIHGIVIFFFVYSIMTGLYGYLASFAFLYTFLLTYFYTKEKNLIYEYKKSKSNSILSSPVPSNS